MTNIYKSIFLIMTLCHAFANDNTQLYDADIQNIIASQNQKKYHTIGEKVAQISYRFLKKPYQLFPLGEGSSDEFNQNPLYRTDVFDCETFVDTVLALANAKNLEDFKKHMNAIRYHNGQPNFLNRNHFTRVDWNQSNQKKYYIQDITHSIIFHQKPIYQTESTYINKKNWYQHLKLIVIALPQYSRSEQVQKLNELQKKGYRTQKNQFSHLNFIPLSALFDAQQNPYQEIFKQIPQGSVIEIARPNWRLEKRIGTRLDISHMGFAIWKNDTLYFRNASSIAHRVIDVPLTIYLKSYLQSPSVKGIHIEQVLDKTKC